MKKIKSILNTTPHCLATCTECGWQGGSSIDAIDARGALFSHMRKENHTRGTLEVGIVTGKQIGRAHV